MTQNYMTANPAELQEKVNVKTQLENAARISAVAFAFFVPLTNAGTIISSVIFLIVGLMCLDRAKWNACIKNPITIAIFIFFGVYMMATFYTVGSTAEVVSSWRKMSRLLYIPLIFPLFYDARWRMAAMIGFLLAMFLSVLASWELRMPFFKDTIFTSLFIAFASYITLHYIVTFSRFRWVTVPLLLVFVYYQFFICTGRSGQVVFFALYFLFAYKNFGKAWRWQIFSLISIAAIFTASVMMPSSFSQRQTLAAQEIQAFIEDRGTAIDDSSMGARLTFADNTFKLIEARPIFGWGSGGFANAYAQNIPPEQAKNIYPVNPHNQYLLTTVETGIFGLLSLLYLFFTMARCFWRSKDIDGKLGVGMVVAIAMGCFVNSWLLDFASMFFLVTYAGILAGCLRE